MLTGNCPLGATALAPPEPLSHHLPVADIRVHIDALAYTREGLKTRDPINLQVGQHNRVVLVRPDRKRPIPFSAGGFAAGTSFPGPPVVSLALFGPPELERSLVQVFAHADPTGSDDTNKALTDRRAQVTVAFLKGDLEPILAASREEAWGVDISQVMLRAVGCDPGPIDGSVGELTHEATRDFQELYIVDNLERRFTGRERHLAELEPTGDLDPATQDALIDAYVARYSPCLSEAQLHPTHPANGCAGFNPVASGSLLAQRRISLVLQDGLPPFHENQPCTSGDDDACILMHADGPRCEWYRQHVAELSFPEFEQRHFQPSWLQLRNGNVLLSTLTTVPDDEDLEFSVFASNERLETAAHPTASILGEQLGSTITCKPRLGVAQVVWEPPPAFDPNDEGQILRGGATVYPTFRVAHARSGARALDPWPRLGVLLLSTDVPAQLADQQDLRYRLFADDGSYDATLRTADGIDSSGYLDLYFHGLPKRKCYSLMVTEIGGAETRVFESVPFAQLEALSGSARDELLDPSGRDVRPLDEQGGSNG